MAEREREREAGSLRHCVAQLRPPAPAQPQAQAQAQAGRRLRALLALRCKHLKEPGGAERFRRGGGLRALLGLLQGAGGPGPGAAGRELELGLSILGNCCTQEGARREVGKLGGIPPLVAILKGFNVTSVQNRAARALGNLALEGENSVTIHESGGSVSHLPPDWSSFPPPPSISPPPPPDINPLSPPPILTLSLPPRY
uniref:armadillo repeat-containing protein 5-like n=1 Tax=Pristiophorus japonicus TaxID=55135 RepID=UPI00398E8682